MFKKAVVITILTLTEKEEIRSVLTKVYRREGIFSFFTSNIEEFDNFDLIGSVLIDGSSSRATARRLCAKLRSSHPDKKIYILIRGAYNASDFSSFDGVVCLGEKFASSRFEKFADTSSLPYRLLKVNQNKNETVLLGYKLHLTPAEHRILLLLASSSNSSVSSDVISELALDSRNKKGSVAVHIYSLNKKAAMISGRRLIISPHNNGYLLNSEM